MPRIEIRGAEINYEVVGDAGPWVTLCEGGHSGVEDVRHLATLVAAEGYRVLIHDRRNCGASAVSIEGDGSEPEIWADDLYELLGELDARPAYAGGSSSGCRTALLLASRHPGSVRGLLLWRVSGGPYASDYLGRIYYDEYIEAATHGGMAAVCETPFFQERIAANPSNRQRLLSMDPARFIDVLSSWRAWFAASAELPAIGMTEDAIRGIDVPTCVITGYDEIHVRAVGEQVAALLPDSELHYLVEAWEGGRRALSPDEVLETDEDLAATFSSFLARIAEPSS